MAGGPPAVAPAVVWQGRPVRLGVAASSRQPPQPKRRQVSHRALPACQRQARPWFTSTCYDPPQSRATSGAPFQSFRSLRPFRAHLHNSASVSNCFVSVTNCFCSSRPCVAPIRARVCVILPRVLWSPASLHRLEHTGRLPVNAHWLPASLQASDGVTVQSAKPQGGIFSTAVRWLSQGSPRPHRPLPLQGQRLPSVSSSWEGHSPTSGPLYWPAPPPPPLEGSYPRNP